ncbi:nucleolar protein 7 isoform X2 [Bombina bombina]|uniref:nucleolar protein 7 isoform X2 n=1 Tax=Bombina bombina TaxID=8345 RepID=UPI00235AADD9|nr:nucleolar protein 7 isoform X2 [Bombina bombina]
MKPEHELTSEGSDDEAPDEVTFKSAKTQAEENAREKRLAVKREKDLLKEKRKQKEELFKEQKKRKLLSEDILQTVSSLPEKTEKRNEEAPQAKGDEGDVRCVKKKKLAPKTKLQDNYSVVRLKEYNLVSLQQETAKSFIQKKLYGKYKNRATANEFLSMKSKKGIVKKPAVQFTDSTWGKEEKQRANKFNLLWTNRKKL